MPRAGSGGFRIVAGAGHSEALAAWGRESVGGNGFVSKMVSGFVWFGLGSEMGSFGKFCCEGSEAGSEPAGIAPLRVGRLRLDIQFQGSSEMGRASSVEVCM